MSEAAELLGPGLRPQPLEGEEKNGQARKGRKSLVRHGPGRDCLPLKQWCSHELEKRRGEWARV